MNDPNASFRLDWAKNAASSGWRQFFVTTVYSLFVWGIVLAALAKVVWPESVPDWGQNLIDGLLWVYLLFLFLMFPVAMLLIAFRVFATLSLVNNVKNKNLVGAQEDYKAVKGIIADTINRSLFKRILYAASTLGVVFILFAAGATLTGIVLLALWLLSTTFTLLTDKPVLDAISVVVTPETIAWLETRPEPDRNEDGTITITRTDVWGQPTNPEK